MAKAHHVVYEEVTPFPTWATIVLLAVAFGVAGPMFVNLQQQLSDGLPVGGSTIPQLAGAGFSIVLPVLIYLLFGRLVVQVTRSSVRLRFGYVPVVAKVVPFGEIERMEAVRYRPLRDFGGWGIRRAWKGNRVAWTMNGDQALVLHLVSGRQFYVGSENPVRLKSRIGVVGDQDPRGGVE